MSEIPRYAKKCSSVSVTADRAETLPGCTVLIKTWQTEKIKLLFTTFQPETVKIV